MSTLAWDETIWGGICVQSATIVNVDPLVVGEDHWLMISVHCVIPFYTPVCVSYVILQWFIFDRCKSLCPLESHGANAQTVNMKKSTKLLNNYRALFVEMLAYSQYYYIFVLCSITHCFASSVAKRTQNTIG